MRRTVSMLLACAMLASGITTVLHPVAATAIPTGSSWSGDYATEEFGDPWDFSNPEDWDPQARAESPGAVGSVSGGTLKFDQTSPAGGVLIGSAHYGNEALQWGRSTWLHPIDTNAYVTLSFRLFEPSRPDALGVELFTCGGTVAACDTHLNAPGNQLASGWNTYSLALPAGLKVYSILIVPGPNQRSGFELDWVRVTRAGGGISPLSTGGSEPIPVVIDPNRGGGSDYATAVRGKAWTFDDGSDIAATNDLTGVSYSAGVMHACNVNNDPAIVLAMGAPLNASVYNRVNARVWYDGAFGLADARGGGMVARLQWHIIGTNGYQISQDIVVYPGWNDIDLPMLTSPPSAVTEPDIGLGIGWVGMIDEVRFDFHEDRGTRCVALDSFAIRAADEARPSFTIRYRDDARGTATPAPGTTAEIFLDPSFGTFAGTRIGNGLAVANGENTFAWHGGSVPKGTYYPWVRLTDPAGHVSSAYASGPLVYSGVAPLAARSITSTPSGAPNGVAAVLANLTMTEAPGSGYVTADKCSTFGSASPTKSNGNFNAGQDIANLGVVPLGADGTFCIFNESPVHLLADVQGYFSPNGDLRFTRWGPNRVLNTRTGARAAHGSVTRVNSGVPGGAAAVLVNLTMTDGLQGGFVTADKCSALTNLPPTKSNGNFIPQRNVANLAVVPIDTDGSFCVYTQSDVHLLADVQGYFSPSGALGFTLLDPKRVLDTRPGAQPTDNTIVRVNPGVVAGTDAVLVNITMTEAAGGGYITADKCTVLQAGLQQKSNGNFAGGQNIANLSVVQLDSDGTFCIYIEHGVDLLVDVQGTFTAGGPLKFSSIAPDRRLDTRQPSP